MAVTTVVLLTLCVALFAPGTANSEMEIVDTENLEKAELVKKEVALEERGRRNNNNNGGGRRNNRRRPAIQPVPAEDPDTLLDTAADIIGGAADGVADFANGVFSIFGEEELETRGRRNGKNGGGRRNNRRRPAIQPVPADDPDTLLDTAADIIGGAADGVADFANGVFSIFGEEELETRGRRNGKNGGGRRNNRRRPAIQPVPADDPDTLLDTAADIIGGAADGVADFANGVFSIFGEEELETRGRRNGKNGGGRRNNRRRPAIQPVPVDDPDTLLDTAADIIGGAADGVADFANGVFSIFGEEELETRGRRNGKNGGGRRNNRRRPAIQPVPADDPDTLLDTAADIIGGAADGVADFANGVFSIFGEEELETRGRRNGKNGGGRRNNRRRPAIQPVPEDEDPDTLLDTAADIIGGAADGVASFVGGAFNLFGEE